MLDMLMNLLTLQGFAEQQEKWHKIIVLWPRRVGTNDDGTPHWAGPGRVIQRRLHVGPGGSDIEYRLPGKEDSYVYKNAGAWELPPI